MSLSLFRRTGLAIMTLGFAGMGLGQAREWHVDAVHPALAGEGDGSAEAPFRRIAQAAEAAQPGDTVLVHPGVYRERVAPARGGTAEAPIVYRSLQPRQAIVKGSDVFAPDWQPVPDCAGVWQAPLPAAGVEPHPGRTQCDVRASVKSLPARPWTDPQAPPPLTLAQLFANGQPLLQLGPLAGVAKTPGSWCVLPDGNALALHLPEGLAAPAQVQVELSLRPAIFAPIRRGLTYIEVRDFVFEHCANQGPFPQGGAVSVRSGTAWTIAGNEIRFANTIGLDIGSQTWATSELGEALPEDRRLIIGGKHLVEGNDVHDNGLCGIAGWNCRGSRLLGNTIARNNLQHFHGASKQWEEDGGIKLHACDDSVIEGNLVIDNEAAGIWFDNGFTNARISRNVVVGNLGKGIFLELGDGPATIDHNIVVGTRRQSGFYAGHGIYAHDASGLRVWHNLIAGNQGCGVLGRVVTNRTLGGDKHLVEASRFDVRQNLIAACGEAAISLPFPSGQARDNQANYNLFAGTSVFTLHNNSGRVSAELMYADLAARLAKAKRPLVQWPNPADWAAKPNLDFANWQFATGWDSDSRSVAAPAIAVKPAGWVLEIAAAAADWRLLGPPIAGMEKDFFGRPRDPAYSLPGPFAELPPGPLALPLRP